MTTMMLCYRSSSSSSSFVVTTTFLFFLIVASSCSITKIAATSSADVTSSITTTDKESSSSSSNDLFLSLNQPEETSTIPIRKRKHMKRRNLATKKCDDELAIITAQDIYNAGYTFIKSLVTTDIHNTSSKIIFRTAINDVKVMKLCTSCKDIDTWYANNGWIFPGYHKTSYCNNDVNGYDTTQSSLVFIPIDNTTGEVYQHVSLRTFITMTPIRTDLNKAPTDEWPTSFHRFVDQYKRANQTHDPFFSYYQNFMINYLPALFAASSGCISLMPDYIGYGESKHTVLRSDDEKLRSDPQNSNRTYLFPSTYEQSGVIHYLHLQKYIFESTFGCTSLDSSVTIYGLEDGSLGAIYVTQALQRFGIKTLSVFTNSGPFDVEMLLVDTIRRYDNNENLEPSAKFVLENTVIPLLSFSYSIDTAGMTNTIIGNDIMSSNEWNDKLIQRFDDDDASIDLPDNPLDLLNEDLLTKFRNAMINGTLPCSSDEAKQDTDLQGLCMSIEAASSWYTINGNNGRGWLYPLQLCYSDQDEIYTSSLQYPVAQLQKHSEHITVYNGPIALEDQLGPNGHNHYMAIQMCTISPFLFFTLQGHRPTNEIDRPYYHKPYTQEQSDICNYYSGGGSGGGGGGSASSEDGGEDGSGGITQQAPGTIQDQAGGTVDDDGEEGSGGDGTGGEGQEDETSNGAGDDGEEDGTNESSNAFRNGERSWICSLGIFTLFGIWFVGYY